MKKFRTALVTAVSLVVFAAVALPASGAGVTDTIKDAHVPNRVLVKLNPGANADAFIKANGLTKKGEVFGDSVLILEAKGKATSALVEALSKNPNVEYAEPDYIATADWTPNDPSFGSQWGPQNVQAPAAWDYTKGSSSVLIAVVDTGVDLDHPDLSTKVRTDIDYDYVNNDSTAQDDNGHGTHVAGIAAAATNNSTGIAGMCPNCMVLPVKVLNSSGSGTYSAIASGINYAVSKGAKVINMSLGGSAGDATLSSAVSNANASGVLLACAAGNSNTSAASYPAYYSGCVAVASTDSGNNKSSFSNYGSWVDTSAPGTSIYATYWNNTYSTLSGTSMATPHVAGLAGLLFSQGRSQSDVKTRLTSSTYTDAVNSSLIPRKINALKAVSL
ncbi:MAG TPA: S8 family peptidase [Symbiobacteriaceae bacterium]|nr:S8 family peptidase [Symbiobacteriaceae bacterium]